MAMRHGQAGRGQFFQATFSVLHKQSKNDRNGRTPMVFWAADSEAPRPLLLLKWLQEGSHLLGTQLVGANVVFAWLPAGFACFCPWVAEGKGRV